MTLSTHTPLLRVPPFPRTAGHSLADGVRAGRNRLGGEDELDQVALALADARVGGAYWSGQPPVPDVPYAVVRIKDAKARLEATAGLAGDRPILLWGEPTAQTTGNKCTDCWAVTGAADPWHLVGGAAEVVVDSDDDLALIAALAKVPLRCIGEGRFADLQNGGAAALRQALRNSVTDLSYVNPFTGGPMELAEAVELCRFWRKMIDLNRGISAAVGFAFWKRPTVEPLLWDGTSDVSFVSRLPAPSSADRVAIWKTRSDPDTLAQLEASDARLIEVEDGFIRSTGLGADCVPPLSIVVDHAGIHFDPSGQSELERLLQDGHFNPQTLHRARRLRELIVDLGVTKYASGTTAFKRRPNGRRHVLVPGQVEDDRSVMSGGGTVTTNFELLRRTRDNAPDAYIIYKPHPDVRAGHRIGAIPDHLCLALADEIVGDTAITSLIEMVDEVHVNTSLAGFEALIREKPVTTYGVPFYAGWGLTRDLGRVPQRRTARRSLDELVAAALLLYPRYLDPVTRLPCPPEILIRRLADGQARRGGAIITLRRLQGRFNRAMLGLWS